MKYAYTDKNLLNHPEKYEYSKVDDDEFLKGYYENRHDFLKKSTKRKEKTYSAFIKNFHTNLDEPYLSKILKKFEVRKRFFPISESKDIEFIVMVSFALSKILKENRDYGYLSTLMKLNDVIVSQDVASFSDLMINFAISSIENEMETVGRIENETE